jgi:hypothetical protein
MLNLDFDYSIMEAIILGRNSVNYYGCSLRLDNDNGLMVTIDDLTTNAVAITSILFDRVTYNNFKLRKCFINFDDKDLINKNVNYRILSTIKFDPFYKCIAYMLLLSIDNRKACEDIVNRMKTAGGNLYNEVRKLMELIVESQVKMEKTDDVIE